MLTEWKKGESMTFEVNPYFQPAPTLKKIVIVIVPDTNQAVAQLLSGDVDYLEKATLGAGAEVQTVLEAAKAGQDQGRDLRQPDLGAHRHQPVHQVGVRQPGFSERPGLEHESERAGIPTGHSRPFDTHPCRTVRGAMCRFSDHRRRAVLPMS